MRPEIQEQRQKIHMESKVDNEHEQEGGRSSGHLSPAPPGPRVVFAGARPTADRQRAVHVASLIMALQPGVGQNLALPVREQICHGGFRVMLYKASRATADRWVHMSCTHAVGGHKASTGRRVRRKPLRARE